MFTAELAERFKTDGMLAYVELIQRKEKEIGCDVFKHQKWHALSLPVLFYCPHQLYPAGAAQTTSTAS